MSNGDETLEEAGARQASPVPEAQAGGQGEGPPGGRAVTAQDVRDKVRPRIRAGVWRKFASKVLFG
jgi:hypothetical protein